LLARLCEIGGGALAFGWSHGRAPILEFSLETGSALAGSDFCRGLLSVDGCLLSVRRSRCYSRHCELRVATR
jgi:hypothetical protein